MPQNGRLRLHLVDVFGRRLQERVDVSLRNLDLIHAPVLRRLDASRVINSTDLFSGPQGHYQVSIDPPSYHPVSRFLDIRSGNHPTEEAVRCQATARIIRWVFEEGAIRRRIYPCTSQRIANGPRVWKSESSRRLRVHSSAIPADRP